MAVTALKLPPHSVEAEQAVLGGLMLDNEAWEAVVGLVTEDDFYRGDHRLIYTALEALADANQPRDVVTVSEWLKAKGQLDEGGGLAYLAQLAKDTPSAANIKAYANIVREKAVMRALIRVGTEITNLGFETEGRGSGELVETAEQRVFEIADRRRKSASFFEPISRLLTGAMDHIQKLWDSKSGITGLATGLVDFDKLTCGLQNGDLVIIAGRPSMGKTSFAMNLVEHICVRDKLPTAIFSMEMSGEQVALRMISSLGRIDQQRLRSGQLQDQDWPRVTSTVALMAEAPLYVDDTGALSPAEVRARSRRLDRAAQQKHGRGLGLIVVDYLQLMQVPGTAENRTTEVSEISRSLKALAKELKVPVIALSQLSRSVEQRPDKRPVMSDLRESGSIEQDADVVVFLYRDEYYRKDSDKRGVAEVIIAKQRNGPVDTVEAAFLGQYTRFENLAREQYRDLDRYA